MRQGRGGKSPGLPKDAPIGPAYAKIDAPRLAQVLERQRLSRLFGASEARVIWVSAPAGYGKTHAVAGWLQAAKIPSIWYQCDEGDADIASFFHFLALTQPAAERSTPLPTLSPELYGALPTFVRHFLRIYYSNLPAGTHLVIDNWQDVPAGAPLRDLLPLVIQEIPQQVTLVVVSREMPGSNLSRIRLSEEMLLVDTETLRLTPAETEAFAAAFKFKNPDRPPLPAAQLHALTHGWAAGVAVLLRADPDTLQALDLKGAAQMLFDYVSAEVLDRQSEDTKDFLLKTACLEYVSVPLAEALTGNARAGEILAALASGNAFTLERPLSRTYYYHPLLREMLRSRWPSRFSEAEQRSLLSRAAECQREQYPEAAIGLHIEARNWEEATELILRCAHGLLPQSRFKTVLNWIDALPAAVRDGSGWLAYWRGISQLALGDVGGSATLGSAHAAFGKSNDILGRMLAASAIIQHHGFSYIDFSPMLPWLNDLDELLSGAPAFPSDGVELKILAGYLNAIAQVQPGSSYIDPRMRRMEVLIHQTEDPVARAEGIVSLLHFHAMCGDTAQFDALEPLVEEALRRPEAGPAMQISIQWIRAYHHYYRGAWDRSAVVLDEALALSERHKLFGFELRVRVSRLQSSDESVPAAMLERQLQDLEPFLSRAPRMVVAHAYYLKAQFWLERGDLQRAKALNTSARGAFERSSWQIAHVLTGLVDAEIECALGRYADARRSLAACDETLADLHIPFVRFCIGVVRALIVRHDEPARFAEILGETLALGRRQGFATTIYRRSPSLRRLLSSALELKIEPDYCRWLIRTRAWHPQAHESALWPWPVRIITLGGFHVSIEDRALATGGKAQQRPLNLLKATLAQRSGVDVGLVMEQLWPDLDGDSARNALDLALHRLRKLLKRPDAIVLTQGRLAVNPDEVWVDAHALDAYEVHELSAAALVDLMRLYRGPFLADEDDAWMFAPRERLRSRFLRLVGELALRLEAEARNEVLGDLYRRALEVEPLAEELYRGYMQCLMRQGRHTEAAATYRRCKETLARSLNVIPSPLTQSLYAQLPGSN